MCAAEGYSTAPKSSLICLCCHGRHPTPPTGAHCIQCSLFYRKWIFFSALVVTHRKGQIHFCLGFPDQSCLHSDNTTCTVKSPAFRTCQNYCVCIAVLLNTFQKAYDSEHAQGFWKCKPRSELLGPYSSVRFRIFTYSLVYLHFAYSEKKEIKGQGYCSVSNCLLVSAKTRITIFIYIFHPHTKKLRF